MARTKVIEIENTHNRAGGTINPIENIKSIASLARKYNLFYHLDGARIWNASVETGISPAEYASHFDSISCCLSKGLGAPVGSIIAGTKDFIKEAFRMRKAWGGGMRQVGILAAAGLFALKNNIPRLKEDHNKAKELARNLSKLENVEIDLSLVQTNIVMFSVKNISVDDFLSKCKENGLLLGTGKVGVIRAVAHIDVSIEQIYEASKIMERIVL
jgi:threonine aldolase